MDSGTIQFQTECDPGMHLSFAEFALAELQVEVFRIKAVVCILTIGHMFCMGFAIN